MKCHHPDVFLAAILNAQPMGFYAPAQLVRDAREHGVEVRPVDVNRSQWDCTLEPGNGKVLAVRLGFNRVRGLTEKDALRIVAGRADRRYSSTAPRQRPRGSPVWDREGRRLRVSWTVAAAIRMGHKGASR
jgi:error-prone DNA polymerase